MTFHFQEKIVHSVLELENKNTVSLLKIQIESKWKKSNQNKIYPEKA